MMKKMSGLFKTCVLVSAVSMLMLAASSLYADKPERNVSRKRHPNIAAAQRLVDKAYERIVAAQKANEFDMEGHAQKAKELLDQVNAELKLAAREANENKRKEGEGKGR